MEIKPLGNRVLLKKQIIKENKTQTGIIIPLDETNPMDSEKQTLGIIVSLGSNVDMSLGLKVKHLVKFAKHSETVVNDTEDLILVEDKNIQAIIYKGE